MRGGGWSHTKALTHYGFIFCLIQWWWSHAMRGAGPWPVEEGWGAPAFPLCFSVFPYLFLPFPCEGHEGASANLFPSFLPSSQLLLGTGTHLAEGRWVPGAAPSLCSALLVLCVCCESGEQGSVWLRRGTEVCFCHATSLLGMTFLFFTVTRTLYYIYIYMCVCVYTYIYNTR